MTDGAGEPPLPPGNQSASQLIERKLATILSADVAEFSRLMNEDEEQTLRAFRGHKKIFESLVILHHGRVFNTAGDAILAEFSSAVEAVRCATDVQSALRTRNDKFPPNRQVRFRIGINLGDVMIQGQDLLGDGVNVAARLQTAAEPGGICISGSVYDQIRNKLTLAFQSHGERNYKNIPQPVRTFSIVEAEGGTPFPSQKPRSAWKSQAIWAVAGLVVIVGVGYAAYALHGRGRIESAPQSAGQAQPSAAPVSPAPPAMATPSAEQPAAAGSQPAANATPPTSRASEAGASSAKVAVPAGDPKPVAKSKPPSSSPEANAGRYDGVYSGQICYGKTPKLPNYCYPSGGAVHGGKITGSWTLPSEPRITVFLEGQIDASGNLRIFIHSDALNGNRVSTIDLDGTIGDGKLKATGEFAKGRPASLNWQRNP